MKSGADIIALWKAKDGLKLSQALRHEVDFNSITPVKGCHPVLILILKQQWQKAVEDLDKRVHKLSSTVGEWKDEIQSLGRSVRDLDQNIEEIYLIKSDSKL